MDNNQAVATTKQGANRLQVIEQKKNEVLNVLNSTVLSQFAFAPNSKEALKKKQEIAMFVSKLSTVEDKNGNLAILSCTIESIRDCCLAFANGEYDFFRNQAYLYPFGNKLTFIPGRDGLIAMAKKFDTNIEDIRGNVIYKNDIFEFEINAGKTTVLKHEQPLKNITAKIDDIIGAYATCNYKDGTNEAEIMVMAEIINSLKTAYKTFGDAHKDNVKEMLSKFPMRRLAKHKINRMAKNDILNVIAYDDEIAVYNDKINNQNIVNVDFSQDEKESEYIEPSAYDDDQINEGEQMMSQNEEEKLSQEDKQEEIKTVKYYDWTNDYKPTGEWEQVKNSYDSNKKTCQIKRV